MSDKVYLTPEQAEALLPDGDTVHTFVNPGVNMLVGADWERASILKAFRSHRVEVSGEHAQAMNHGLAFHDGTRWVFVETKKANETAN